MAEEKEPKSKEYHTVNVQRSIVAAIAEETGAPVNKILSELAAQLTPEIFKAVRDKLRPAAGALEAALGEKPGEA